jgi:hypothetical protein
MNVARSLERQLERLLEGVFGRVFSGRLHASEIATRIAREADLARFQHPSGPATANYFTLTFNPKDIDDAASQMAAGLTDSFASYAAEAGLRLVGPPHVTVKVDESVAPGQFLCHLEIVPGEERPWARLTDAKSTYQVRFNRSIVGRSSEADVVVDYDDISRSHALVWRSGGSVHITDLGSANGTLVDGKPVGTEPVEISTGSVVQLGSRTFRFVEINDA